MVIGRSEDRDTPWHPTTLRRRARVEGPIRVTHLGQRSIRPHTQAGHMTAIADIFAAATPCNPGAVHTWGARAKPGHERLLDAALSAFGLIDNAGIADRCWPYQGMIGRE